MKRKKRNNPTLSYFAIMNFIYYNVVAEATIVKKKKKVCVDDPFPFLSIHLSIYRINIFKPLKNT